MLDMRHKLHMRRKLHLAFVVEVALLLSTPAVAGRGGTVASRLGRTRCRNALITLSEPLPIMLLRIKGQQKHPPLLIAAHK